MKDRDVEWKLLLLKGNGEDVNNKIINPADFIKPQNRPPMLFAYLPDWGGPRNMTCLEALVTIYGNSREIHLYVVNEDEELIEKRTVFNNEIKEFYPGEMLEKLGTCKVIGFSPPEDVSLLEIMLADS